jgi:uncharacterized membrane protein
VTTPAPDVPGKHEAAPVAYEVAPANATEPKVIAATGGATAGVIVTNFALYLIAGWFYGGHDVPMVVALFIGLVITSGMAFGGGYFARHVQRP